MQMLHTQTPSKHPTTHPEASNFSNRKAEAKSIRATRKSGWPATWNLSQKNLSLRAAWAGVCSELDDRETGDHAEMANV
jgi:plasmid replication initiation protein